MNRQARYSPEARERDFSQGGGFFRPSGARPQTEVMVNFIDLSIRYSECLAKAGFKVSVGLVGDSHDNALAETINGLFKAEVIHKDALWRGMEDMERTTLTWVEWFNNRRSMEPPGDIRPREFEANCYRQNEQRKAA